MSDLLFTPKDVTLSQHGHYWLQNAPVVRFENSTIDKHNPDFRPEEATIRIFVRDGEPEITIFAAVQGPAVKDDGTFSTRICNTLWLRRRPDGLNEIPDWLEPVVDDALGKFARLCARIVEMVKPAADPA